MKDKVKYLYINMLTKDPNPPFYMWVKSTHSDWEAVSKITMTKDTVYNLHYKDDIDDKR